MPIRKFRPVNRLGTRNFFWTMIRSGDGEREEGKVETGEEDRLKPQGAGMRAPGAAWRGFSLACGKHHDEVVLRGDGDAGGCARRRAGHVGQGKLLHDLVVERPLFQRRFLGADPVSVRSEKGTVE